MENRQITERRYYAVTVSLASPLCVSNGESEYTDADIIKNAAGEYFLPGSSIAGAWRDYLNQKKDENGILGFSKDKEGRMSPVLISDLYFSSKARISVRDGVKLGRGKSVLNKYDLEIIETGAEGTLFFSIVIREGDAWDYKGTIARLFQAMQAGEIRFGANKNRGMGKLQIESVYESFFSKEDVDRWIAFSPYQKTEKSQLINHYDNINSYEKWSQEHNVSLKTRYISITIPLSLKGGISIRRYSTKPAQADYEHITTNGKPVVPGASWNGAIRSDAGRILNDLGCKHTNKLLRTWFGCINTDLNDSEEDVSGEQPHQSLLAVSESIIADAVSVPVTRNKVNRFDASTIEGALYTDLAFYGGTTCLHIMVRKDTKSEYEALLGLLQIIIQDVQEGYLPVGGLVSIGRGIFKIGDGEVEYSENIDADRCLEKLYSLL